MKMFAIILFAEVGLHLVFTLFTMYGVFLYVAHDWWEPLTRRFFSDLPEDPVEVSIEQLKIREVKTRPDVDHRYGVALVAWRMIEFLRRKKQVSEDSHRMTSLA